MKNIFVTVVFLLTVLALNAQIRLSEVEKDLKLDFENLQKLDSDSLKLQVCNKIGSGLEGLLSLNESFDYPFAVLDRMGKLIAPDRTFRIYTWNCVLSDGTYHYFGLIQRKTQAGLQVERLFDLNSDKDLLTFIGDSQSWPGALYYQIIPFKIRNTLSYLLLGWDGNNLRTNKKVIEVLSFDENGCSQFGMALLYWRGKTLNRIVFEYSKQAQMLLRYDEDQKRVVFDHLSPSSSQYQNQFEYYGPDFSYDALEFRKGRWELIENIDIRNKKTRKK